MKVKRELVTLKTDNTVLLKALEQKTSQSLDVVEMNSRLKASLDDQNRVRHQKRQLQMLQAELQREKLEVHSEKAKLQVSAVVYFHAHCTNCIVCNRFLYYHFD